MRRKFLKNAKTLDIAKRVKKEMTKRLVFCGTISTLKIDTYDLGLEMKINLVLDCPRRNCQFGFSVYKNGELKFTEMLGTSPYKSVEKYNQYINMMVNTFSDYAEEYIRQAYMENGFKTGWDDQFRAVQIS